MSGARPFRDHFQISGPFAPNLPKVARVSIEGLMKLPDREIYLRKYHPALSIFPIGKITLDSAPNIPLFSRSGKQ
jgi:hypothetical protein